MANIVLVKKHTEALTRRTDWNPARLVRELVQRGAARRSAATRRGFPLMEPAFSPPFEVIETSTAYIFTADLPGVSESDLELTLAGKQLSVSGQRPAEPDEGPDGWIERYHICERGHGSFTRSFTLPEDIDPDHLEAKLEYGVLTLVVPKTPATHPTPITLGHREPQRQAP